MCVRRDPSELDALDEPATHCSSPNPIEATDERNEVGVGEKNSERTADGPEKNPSRDHFALLFFWTVTNLYEFES